MNFLQKVSWLLVLKKKTKQKFTKYQLKSDLGSLLTFSRIWKLTIFVLCQQYRVWMSSTADQTSKNTSEISHCKLSIGFSLSWESMHFRHLASKEYDLFDPLNHVWEGVKKKKKRRTADWLSRKQSRCYSSERDRREGRGRSAGWRAQKEKKGRYFYFDFITQTYDHSILCLFGCFVCHSQEKHFSKIFFSIKGDYSDHFQQFMLNFEKKISH